MKRLIALGLVSMVALIAPYATIHLVLASPAEQVGVCHNGHVLILPAPAAELHLAHGDALINNPGPAGSDCVNLCPDGQLPPCTGS